MCAGLLKKVQELFLTVFVRDETKHTTSFKICNIAFRTISAQSVSPLIVLSLVYKPVAMLTGEGYTGHSIKFAFLVVIRIALESLILSLFITIKFNVLLKLCRLKLYHITVLSKRIKTFSQQSFPRNQIMHILYLITNYQTFLRNYIMHITLLKVSISLCKTLRNRFLESLIEKYVKLY